MPTIYKNKDQRYYFHSSDGNEPPHVHVKSNTGTAKVWIQSGKISHSNMNARENVEITRVINQNRESFLSAWIRFFTMLVIIIALGCCFYKLCFE